MTRKILVLLMAVLLFASGLLIYFYPNYHGSYVDHTLRNDANDFLCRTEPPQHTDSTPRHTHSAAESTPPETVAYQDLLEDMKTYNQTIYINGQAGLSSKLSYEEPSFLLADYGLDSEIFGVISIPKLEIKLPIYLGATYQHMNDGAAHLSQTSLPIGGENTNCVIAGHRGWSGAHFFRYITDLEYGDTVTITNLWETLHYTVVDTQIIEPDEVDQILIQPGHERLTLLTCHPYASGGKQRYLVICERTEHE